MATKRGAGTGAARKRAGSKRAGSKRAGTKRAAGKRELLEPRAGDKRYVRRTAKGKFTDSQDDVGRSLAQDVKKRARRKVAAGRGDEGDQQRSRPERATAKKGAAKRGAAKKGAARKGAAKKGGARKSARRG